MRFIVRAVVLAAAIAAPVLAFGGQKVVRVDVDGEIRPVSTYADSAPVLLERIGMRPSSRDLVVSAAEGALVAGETVRLRRAKVVRVSIDGRPKTVLAHGLTVGEALRGLGLGTDAKDYVRPQPASRLREGMTIVVRNALRAKVRIEGETRDVVTNAATVGELLQDAGIRLGERDYVRPVAATRPTDGMWVRVVRVRESVVERTVRIPFRYVERRDASLERGVRKLAQQGAEGIKVRRYSVVLEDGERVASELVSERVVREPRDNIVRIGTGEPRYEGSGHEQSGIASWFEADGLVAAHRTLPIGTVVRVTNVATGKSVSVRINQRGPTRADRVIDLSDDAFQELAPLGAGTVRVRVQW